MGGGYVSSWTILVIETIATIKVGVKVATRFHELKLNFRYALPRNYPTNDGPTTETLKFNFFEVIQFHAVHNYIKTSIELSVHDMSSFNQ
jgi:hypothetical protein